jgi:DNA-binding PadR family transcriptional regulator
MPFGVGPFSVGPGGPRGPFGLLPFGRAAKARRGDVRAAALLLLAEAPRNGYQLMQEIESRSGGAWRPSPGSIYPTLQQLEDEGLVGTERPEGRRLHHLTDAGREHVAAHAAALGSPWDVAAESVDGGVIDFHAMLVQLVVAARQVRHAGDLRQVAEARQVLVEARRRLYRILAEEPKPDAGPPADGGGARAVDPPDGGGPSAAGAGTPA